jgi:hypothetical protein
MISTFTIGALGMAAVIGLGNGAVFKLVPEYSPTQSAASPASSGPLGKARVLAFASGGEVDHVSPGYLILPNLPGPELRWQTGRYVGPYEPLAILAVRLTDGVGLNRVGRVRCSCISSPPWDPQHVTVGDLVSLTVLDFAYEDTPNTPIRAGDTGCRADLTGDGAVTIQDFLAFLQAFAHGCP